MPGRWAFRARSCALLTLVGVATSVLPAAPVAADDAHSKQQQVREDKAKAAAKLNVLKANNQQVQSALDTLSSNVQGASAALTSARNQAAAAAAAAKKATADASAALGRLQGARDALVADAVRAYTDPLAGGPDRSGVATDDIAEAARKIEYERLRNGSQADALDGARAARLELEEARARAQSASDAAAKRQADVTTRLAKLISAQHLQQQLTDAYEQKIEAAQNELGGLNAQDAALSAEIARQDAARGAGGGNFSVASGGSAGGIALATVGGITVAASIAGQLASLLSAASAAGLHLGGGGYRSSASQIELRRAHCGSSSYAIYQAPSSSCSPPTAPPGSSMHERGLAIDFTNNGSLISSHSDPAFRWLAGNAGRFGFANLPSEPWHWSVNGR